MAVLRSTTRKYQLLPSKITRLPREIIVMILRCYFSSLKIVVRLPFTVEHWRDGIQGIENRKKLSVLDVGVVAGDSAERILFAKAAFYIESVSSTYSLSSGGPEIYPHVDHLQLPTPLPPVANIRIDRLRLESMGGLARFSQLPSLKRLTIKITEGFPNDDLSWISDRLFSDIYSYNTNNYDLKSLTTFAPATHFDIILEVDAITYKKWPELKDLRASCNCKAVIKNRKILSLETGAEFEGRWKDALVKGLDLWEE